MAYETITQKNNLLSEKGANVQRQTLDLQEAWRNKEWLKTEA